MAEKTYIEIPMVVRAAIAAVVLAWFTMLWNPRENFMVATLVLVSCSVMFWWGMQVSRQDSAFQGGAIVLLALALFIRTAWLCLGIL